MTYVCPFQSTNLDLQLVVFTLNVVKLPIELLIKCYCSMISNIMFIQFSNLLLYNTTANFFFLLKLHLEVLPK